MKANELVVAWRELEGKRKEFAELVNNWDLLIDWHKNSKCSDPQQLKRTLVKDLRKTETRFRGAMKALEKAVE